MLIFDGYPPEEDTLLVQHGDKLQFKNESPLERFASRNTLTRMVPIATAVTTVGLANKALGRSKPFQKAAVFVGTTIVGAASEISAVRYAESRSGFNRGKLDDKGALATMLRRHQAHHDEPWVLEAGTTRRQRAAVRLLKRAGLAEDIEKPEAA